MVSLQRGEASLSPFLSRARSLFPPPALRLRRFRLRRAAPPGARRAFLSSPQPPSSSVFLLRSPSGASRTSSVALISSVAASSSRSGLGGGRRDDASRLAPSHAALTPADPARPARPTAIPSRAYTIGIFLVAPSILPLLSPSPRLVQER